ncbi:MAG: HlyD family efflux transporter periplasmic adaptor subunit [Bacteroidales bacterium]|nr:HlyD family efflux transporter periplasmic adaptor subunit [Bacteroidales bacterium]
MKNRMKPKWIIVGLAAVLYGCGSGKDAFDASGVFEATEIIVSSQASGQMPVFEVDEGAKVTAGRQLGYVDTVQLHLKKLQLLASLKALRSRRTDVAVQVASINQQIAAQKNELKRFEYLLESNAASQKQVDDIRAQLAMLEKQSAAQQATLESGNSSLSGESLALEIQVAQVDDQLKKSLISSPISGVVLSKYAEAGEFVTTGKALFKVADVSRMHLRAYITADLITQLKTGQQVTVFADFGEKAMKAYAGTVTWIADRAEFTPKNIQTRNERANQVYAVKIAVQNDGYLKRGMYGQLKIENGQTDGRR